MDWILSATSIAMLYLMGNKSKWGPLVGVTSQALWIYYVITTKQYGLVPGVLMFTAVHVRNLIKWSREK